MKIGTDNNARFIQNYVLQIKKKTVSLSVYDSSLSMKISTDNNARFIQNYVLQIKKKRGIYWYMIAV